MLNKFYIIAESLEELEKLISSTLNFHQDDFPVYVYYDGYITDFVSRSLPDSVLCISFKQYEEVTKILAPIKNELYFDSKELKVISSKIDLVEKDEDRFVKLPEGTEKVYLSAYLGFNEVILFVRGNVQKEIYDFSQNTWISYGFKESSVNDITDELWNGTDVVEYSAEKDKVEVKQSYTTNKEKIENEKSEDPNMSDCDISFILNGAKRYYKIEKAINEHDYSLLTFEDGTWKQCTVILSDFVKSFKSLQVTQMSERFLKLILTYKILTAREKMSDSFDKIENYINGDAKKVYKDIERTISKYFR